MGLVIAGRRRLVLALVVTVIVIGAIGASLAARSAAPASLTVATRAGESLGFEPAAAVVVADGAVSVTLDNRSSQAHNLVFVEPALGATRTIVEAGTRDTFTTEPPGVGVYRFVCTIHEGMQGTVEIVAPSPATTHGSRTNPTEQLRRDRT